MTEVVLIIQLLINTVMVAEINTMYPDMRSCEIAVESINMHSIAEYFPIRIQTACMGFVTVSN